MVCVTYIDLLEGGLHHPGIEDPPAYKNGDHILASMYDVTSMSLISVTTKVQQCGSKGG